ncbi:tetratricopeptide repeat protein [bacterium]|nr:tetratricopeptide repeat protein [bacterium]
MANPFPMRAAWAFLMGLAVFGPIVGCGGPDSRKEEAQTVPGDTALGDAAGRLYPQDPKDLSGMVTRIRQLLDDQNFSYARSFLDKARKLDSLNADVLELEGRIELLANQSRKADSVWRVCAAVYPQNAVCRVERAKLQLALGLDREALKLANEAIAVEPNAADAYYVKGLAIRAGKQDTTGAIPYFQKAVDLDNGHLEALDMLGYIFSQRKDSLALAYYRNILKIDPNRSDVYFKMGVFHMDQEDWNRAMEAYSTAIKMNPKDIDSHYNLGYVYLQINQFAEARNSFARAIAASPSQQNYRAYYGRAYAFERLGDLDNARKDYQSVLQVKPNHIASREGLERVIKKLNL